MLIDFEKNEHKAPSFLAIDPMGKLPTIVHRRRVVTETAAIIAYVADTFAQPAGAGSRRCRARRRSSRPFFGAGCFEPALLDTMMKRPEVERKSAVGWGSYEDVVGTLKQALASGHIVLR